MKRMMIALPTVLAAALAAYAEEPAKVMETSAGKVWTDAAGMTLCTFDKEAAGKTNCYDGCARNWPPFAAEAGAMAEGKWSLVERKDGTMMWAYDGHPLYTFIGDKAAGDVTGDGKGGAWHVAKAD